nr:MAG TPA: hypothetical protein [Bacteriophage sp.]
MISSVPSFVVSHITNGNLIIQPELKNDYVTFSASC